MISLRLVIRRLWVILRRVTGDDAYDRYAAHWSEHHAEMGHPLSRKAFQAAEVRRRWNGIKRCC
ncbi:MAG: CstA-like transporter-associated (seleno)protein [Methylococcaceae bacterium]